MELNKNTTKCFEQIQEAALNKLAITATYLLSHKLQTRYAKHCWRIKDEHISNVLQWTTSHEHTSVGRPVKTYFHQLCAGSGCHLEDLTWMMADRNWYRERERERKRESQGNPCYHHDWVMMMTNPYNKKIAHIYIYIYILNHSALGRCDTSWVFKRSFDRFEVRVFFLLYWFPFQG